MKSLCKNNISKVSDNNTFYLVKTSGKKDLKSDKLPGASV